MSIELLGDASPEDDYLQLVADPQELCGASNKESVSFNYEHYEICQSAPGKPCELGRGSMGVTYKAYDTDLHCEVALKVIHPAILGSKEAGELFLREARSLAQLRHPNIATIYRLGHGEDGTCFYAMEYIKGETLEDYVRREGAVPWQKALRIVKQVAQALQTAHQRRFIHRDIKPTNIMLAEETSGSEGFLVKVIDFGLVKTAPEGNSASTIHIGYFAGTPYYASPEQLGGEAIDTRLDIYSLGKCLWFMLVGSPSESSLQNHFDVPAAVLEMVSSMLAESPSERPQTAAALLDWIGKCPSQVQTNVIGEEAVIPEGAEPAPWHKIGEHPRWILIPAILLLGFSVLTVSFALRGNHRKTELEAHARSADAAQELYRQGEQQLAKRTPDDIRHAIECYRRAIAISPDFANAYAALSIAQFQLIVRVDHPADDIQAATANAERATALAPQLPRGYHALSAIYYHQGRPWDALAQVRRALELDPNYLPAMRDFCKLWTAVGQPQRGLPWGIAAAQADPTSLLGLSAVAETSVDLCADERAEEYYRRCLEIKPGWLTARYGLCQLYLLHADIARAQDELAAAKAMGGETPYFLALQAQLALFDRRWQDAEPIYRKLLEIDRAGAITFYGSISYLSALGMLRCRAGDKAEGEAMLNEASRMHVANSDGPHAAYDLAAIRAIQGRVNEALLLLDQAIAARWLDYRSTEMDPRFDALRGHPRFQHMLVDLKKRVDEMRQEATRLCEKRVLIAEYPMAKK